MNVFIQQVAVKPYTFGICHAQSGQKAFRPNFETHADAHAYAIRQGCTVVAKGAQS